MRGGSIFGGGEVTYRGERDARRRGLRTCEPEHPVSHLLESGIEILRPDSETDSTDSPLQKALGPLQR